MATAAPAPAAAPVGQAASRNISNPYFVQKVRLQSFHAQQVFERGFDICARSIFSLSVVLRVIGSDEQARSVEGIADGRLNTAVDEVRAETLRLDKLAETNGIEFTGVAYTSPREFEAQITSPRAVRYIGIIREFDGLVAKFDTLWLSGAIPDGDYSRHVYQWKRGLLRLAGDIGQIARRAMNAARTKEVASKKDVASDTVTSGALGVTRDGEAGVVAEATPAAAPDQRPKKKGKADTKPALPAEVRDGEAHTSGVQSGGELAPASSTTASPESAV